MSKPAISISSLVQEAKLFCEIESEVSNEALYGVTDGKAVGTFIEQKFKNILAEKYEIELGNAAIGIDLPSDTILTDIKVTSIKQPQSSCPFKDAKQKIFGLGYNLLVFVYDKQDNPNTKTANLNFINCTFIEKDKTADYQTTFTIRQMIQNNANQEDVFAYLIDRNIPADEITLMQLAQDILENPPQQGYLTISNALQWRLQYGRIVHLTESVAGITQIVKQAK